MEQLMNLLNSLPQEALQALKEKVTSAKTAEDVIAIAKELGFDLPAEAAEKIISAITGNQSGELSEDQLENVAGGFDLWDTIKDLLLPNQFMHPIDPSLFIYADDKKN